MATDLATGAIPAYYREVYQLCAGTGNVVSPEMVSRILVKSGLPTHTFNQIWTEADARPESNLTQTKLYKVLALVALAQQGKQPAAKLLENFAGSELPVPDLGDLMLLLANTETLPPTYVDLCGLDEIEVALVPEKKGLFLKHVEYMVVSRRLGSSVCRRYTDFVMLREALLARFPYRLVPKLPPKKIVLGDVQFLEERRRGLHCWLLLIARHPMIYRDAALETFLAANGDDLQSRLRELTRRPPDEEDASPAHDVALAHATFLRQRDEIQACRPVVARLQHLADSLAQRSQRYAREVTDLASQLEVLGGAGQRAPSATTRATGSDTWCRVKNTFRHIARELGVVSGRATAQAGRGRAELAERIRSLREVLAAHEELCDRHERAAVGGHARALAKLQELKRRQIHGPTPDSEAGCAGEAAAVLARQENVMASVERRDAIALRCLHEETQVAHAHLALLPSVLAALVRGQAQAHAELAEAWRSVEAEFIPQTQTPTQLGSNGQ